MVSIFCLPPTLRYIARPCPLFRPRTQHLLLFSTVTTLSSQRQSLRRAYALLDSLQSNRSIVSSISSSPDINQNAIPEMLEWLRKAGYSVADLARLKCIHIAGTKGKGSVAVMVENILAQYQAPFAEISSRGKSLVEGRQPLESSTETYSNRTPIEFEIRQSPEGVLGKIGMFTSPHLISVRERIRINGKPILPHLFTHYFFQLWDRFNEAGINSPSESNQPGYFRFLTILAFHVFIQEGVETAIIECGIGGEHDSTNILPASAVTVSAITSLGVDHVGMLGDTIEKIAWHKGGIMKRGVTAFTVEQAPEAQNVLEYRAEEKSTKLVVVKRLDVFADWDTPSAKVVDEDALATIECSADFKKTPLKRLKLGLDGDFQKINASLAVAIASTHLKKLTVHHACVENNVISVIQGKIIKEATEGINQTRNQICIYELPLQFIKALVSVKWPGRCETRKEGNIDWFIDGAHTKESLKEVAHWYNRKVVEAEPSPSGRATMLIFSQQDRDATELLRTLVSAVGEGPSFRAFKYAVFCTYYSHKKDNREHAETQLSLQRTLSKAYEKIDHGNKTHDCFGSVEEALDCVRKVALVENKLLVLVTGSLHLVGSLLKIFKQEDDRARRAKGNLQDETQEPESGDDYPD